MGNEVDEKFTWVINNFSTTWQLSDIFVVGRCKWRLVARFKENKGINCLSLILAVVDYASLPRGWKRYTKSRINVVNQLSENLSRVIEAEEWFSKISPALKCFRMLPLTELHAKYGGFMTNGEVKIVVELDVLEVIGKFDVPEEAENSTQRFNVSGDLLNKANQLNESVDVSGFQIFPSQVESVRRIFEKYPDFASKFRSKNQHLKSTYMNVLLGVIQTLCQSPQELSDDDLDEASAALSYVAKAGFEVDWLEKKLEEVKEKKKKVDIGMASLQQMEKELQELNQKWVSLKILLDNEHADVRASYVALSFDDVV